MRTGENARTHYLGTAYGAHPYPYGAEFSSGYWRRGAASNLNRKMTAGPADGLRGCLNAIGLFYPFIEDESVSMVVGGGKGLYLRSTQRAFRGISGRLWVLIDYQDGGQIQ